MEIIYYFIYSILLLLFSPFILFGIFLKYPKTFLKYFFTGLPARLGFVSGLKMDASQRPIWIHAASLGECRAAAPLVYALRKKYPAVPIAFSSMTFMGISEALKLKLGDRVFYAPLDIRFALKAYFRNINPQTVILLESELWPNWIRAAKEQNCAIGIVNGRISRKSADRYVLFSNFCKTFTGKIDFVCAREKTDAERFERIGILKENIHVTGNLKFDVLPWELNGNSGGHTPFELPVKSPLLVAGSLREGEEQPILNAYINTRKSCPGLKLIFAPRHIDNSGSIVNMAQSMGLVGKLKTEFPYGGEWDVLVWDTLGDLWEAYRLGTIVFVGGSLVPKGGQNPIEPAWFSKPVLFGPFMDNFSEPAKLLLETGGAMQARDAMELSVKITLLLSDPQKLENMGKNAKNAVENLRGRATSASIKTLEAFINAG